MGTNPVLILLACKSGDEPHCLKRSLLLQFVSVWRGIVHRPIFPGL